MSATVLIEKPLLTEQAVLIENRPSTATPAVARSDTR
jgi:hypothetical protein